MLPRNFLILGLFLLSGCADVTDAVDGSLKSNLSKQSVNQINHLNADQAVAFSRLQIYVNDIKKDLCRINLKSATATIDWFGAVGGNSLTGFMNTNLYIGAIKPGKYRFNVYCYASAKGLLMEQNITINSKILVEIPSAQTSYYLGDIKLMIESSGYSGVITAIEIIDNMKDAQADFNRLVAKPNIKALPVSKQLPTM